MPKLSEDEQSQLRSPFEYVMPTTTSGGIAWDLHVKTIYVLDGVQLMEITDRIGASIGRRFGLIVKIHFRHFPARIVDV